jgi:hypothetical protein
LKILKRGGNFAGASSSQLKSWKRSANADEGKSKLQNPAGRLRFPRQPGIEI